VSELFLTRRALIQKTVLASGGLALGFQLGDATDALAASPFAPSAWLRIEPTGTLVFVLDKAEMGQGVHTSLPTILAEELGVSPDAFVIEHAPFAPAYANPALVGMQATGGSTSVATSFEPLRRAGATARAMLVAAAAKDWKLPASECHTPGDGTVRHAASKRQRSYAELAALAAQEPVPGDVSLKDPKSFVHIGKSRPRLDGQAKVSGTAGFGIDVQLPDLRCAALILCPVLGGKPTSFDATKAKAMPGVEDVVMTSRGVAVVAQKYWQARAAAAAVTVTWDEGPLAKVSTEGVFADFAKAARARIEKVSDSSAARGLLSGTTGVLGAEYQVPYLAHAPMEPINCTARVTDKTCEVWAPTQHVSQARQVAHEASGVPLDQVQIHTTFLGGGFGRRLYQDYVHDVVEIAAAVKKPVKMIWSREDDIRHDYYRPGSVHALRAALDDKGMPLVWGQAIAGQSILAQTLPEWLRSLLPGWVPGGMKSAMGSLTGGLIGATGQDDTSVEGAKDLAYEVGTLLVEYDFVDPAIPVGFWRSVGHSYNGFVVESFVDELAHAAKQDPLQYRKALLKDKPRHLRALDLVASKAAWTEKPRQGVFRGIAVHQSFGSVCAQVVELSIENGKTIKLHRIVAAIDCGRAVNPDHVAAQVTSGIVYGLSGALLGDVSIKDGKVEQSNFHDYPVLRMIDTPPIEVHIVPSEAAPSGVGEPGLPPVAAAIGNAVFAATGKRLRKIPLSLS
jgi:CO/xanthine dehydrogenase Mo-binding subunit